MSLIQTPTESRHEAADVTHTNTHGIQTRGSRCHSYKHLRNPDTRQLMSLIQTLTESRHKAADVTHTNTHRIQTQGS
eukprot:1147366-Pelagomonas_calceolata.AAC.1